MASSCRDCSECQVLAQRTARLTFFTLAIWVSLGIFWAVFFYIIMTKIRGATKLQRCATLFRDIKSFYGSSSAEDQLPKLVPTMLRSEVPGKIKSLKLRAKAGDASPLVPCQLEIARKYLDATSPAEATMLHASQQPFDLYSCLRVNDWDAGKLAAGTQKFLLFFAALEQHFLADKPSRVKPKAHQLVELSRFQTNQCILEPTETRTWGTLALLGQRRGRKFSVSGASKSILLRFLAARSLPDLE